MEYTVKQLAELSGVSCRTLRYYDSIGLLKPERIASNGYRIYGQRQVDLLQQILFYRAVKVPLDEIRRILSHPEFFQAALRNHLQTLWEKRKRLDVLIDTVEKSIASLEGGYPMQDQEKFEGLKHAVIRKNRESYGAELEERYGAEQIATSEEEVAEMSVEEWNAQEGEQREIVALLRSAMEEGDPAGAEAQAACDLHRQWLCRFWPEGTYCRQAHRMMGEMYVSDERFRAYYEAIEPGCAEFFQAALEHYCREEDA